MRGKQAASVPIDRQGGNGPPVVVEHGNKAPLLD
jgi:hypothetical protein